MLISSLQHLIFRSVQSLFPQIQPEEIEIEIPKNPEFGDYSTNVAMNLAKTMRKKPLDIARKIKSKLPHSALIAKVEVVPPGFINFFLKGNWLKQQIQKYKLPRINLGQGKTVVIDYSAPNVAKLFTIGHLRTLIIGDSLKRILQFLGYKAIGDDHLGDWGTQFGKLICAYRLWGDKRKIEKEPLEALTQIYQKFHEEAEKNPDLDQQAREDFKKLEQGDKQNLKLWKWFKDLSLREFNQYYQEFGVKFDYTLGESFYLPMLKGVIKDLLKEKVAVANPDGSVAVNFEEAESLLPSCLIQKSDGATLYITRDIATIKYRLQKFHPVKIIYVVGAPQILNFKQLFAITKQMGWNCEYQHISFGSIRDKSGIMGTRKGNVVYLRDVLKEAKERVEKILKEKQVKIFGKQRQKLIHQIAIGALKYNDLSQNRLTDILFDWDKILTLEGNSGPYLQYSYARAKSILRKNVGARQAWPVGKGPPWRAPTLEPLERQLALKILQFSESVLLSAQEYKPNHLANYLYELASDFNSFYNKLPVLHAEKHQRALRLGLVKSFCLVLKHGLSLLGIEVPEKM